MKKIFITYSHADTDFVDRLVEELELSGLDVTLDKKILTPGESLLRIFEEIGVCDFLLPILSNSSIDSNWVQKELEIAIIKEIEDKDFRVVPVIKQGESWNALREKMPGKLKEALRNKYAARFDSKSHEDAIKELLKALAPQQDPQGVYAKIYGARSDNPFRRVRTEYFEDVRVLARSFAEPESIRYDRIVEVKPTIIEGGRGSGKTMLLKSLETRVSVFRRGAKTIKEAELKHFGAYCRLTQGAFATQEGNILNHVQLDMATRLFESELILQLVQSLIEEVQQCTLQEILHINAQQESSLICEIARQIKPKEPECQQLRDFRWLKRFIQIELRSISEYLGRKIFGEAPVYEGVFLDKAVLCEVSDLVVQAIPELNKATIYFLLDEYENLLPFQKVVLNTLVKWAESSAFTIKIATKKTGFQDPRTLEGQELEEGHDYSPVDLDYDLSDTEHRKHYKNLLVNICKEVLESEGYTNIDIRSLLEKGPRYDGLSESAVDATIASMIKEQSGKEWAELDERSRKEYRHRLEMGALYRSLKRNQRKIYAGFDDLALLSSGIIRYFLELCGMSYYFAMQEGTNVKGGEQIKVAQQSDAAYTLSSYYLATIRKNIVDYGPHIQQLTIDLGGIFRQKLLKHLSEPEAARLTISDPHVLEDGSMREVKKLLDTAVMHSVLQVRRGIGGIRPKHPTDVQPREYLINRIYAPELKYSPRPRWRTDFETQDISGLLDPMLRKDVKTKLIRKVTVPEKEERPPVEDDQRSLFGEQS